MESLLTNAPTDVTKKNKLKLNVMYKTFIITLASIGHKEK